MSLQDIEVPVSRLYDELNAFKSVELSYKTHPDLSLMVALTMSCALPGLFMPVCIENECYMDGGVMTNYPINYCLLQQGISKEEILGVKKTLLNEAAQCRL